MSDPEYRERAINYQLKSSSSPDQVLYLENINAYALQVPSGGFGVQFAIGHLPLSWHWVSILNSFIDSIDNIVETRAIFPYKFKIEVVAYDATRLDHSNDGIARFRFGSLSLLHADSFIAHRPVHYKKDFWFLDDVRNAVVVESPYFTANYNNAGAAIHREYENVDRFPTHIAFRLNKSVRVKLSVWWLYRTTIFDIVPTAPI